MAITDSLSSLSLPSRCCSTTNRRNRAMRSFREKPALASTRSSCCRAPCMPDSVGGICFELTLAFYTMQMYKTLFQHACACFNGLTGPPYYRLLERRFRGVKSKPIPRKSRGEDDDSNKQRGLPSGSSCGLQETFENNRVRRFFTVRVCRGTSLRPTPQTNRRQARCRERAGCARAAGGKPENCGELRQTPSQL